MARPADWTPRRSRPQNGRRSFPREATAMGEREIRAKYGGHLAKAINRAIRAEVAGGNEALERLTQLAGAARQSRWTDKQGRKTAEAAAYFRHQREVVGRMEAEVRKRWG